MCIENKVKGVDFGWYVGIHKKYGTDTIQEVIQKYNNIVDHIFEFNPNQRVEWYQEEALRRTENYFKATHTLKGGD